MYAAAQKWFAEGAVCAQPDLEQTLKGHGRIVSYRIWATEALAPYFQQELNWPWAGQVLRIERRCWYPKTDHREYCVHYAVTDLQAEQACISQLFEYWRGHWSVENKGHWVLDTGFAEDHSTARKGSLPAVFSMFRSAVISLLRLSGKPGIATARASYAANVQMACSLIGIP
jgi:hypothetical protein